MPSKKKKSLISILGTKNKRVYTLTTPQYIVGFIVSISFSMLFSPLFERYAPRYLTAVSNAVGAISSLQNTPSSAELKPRKAETIKKDEVLPVDPYEEIRLKLRQMSKSE